MPNLEELIAKEIVMKIKTEIMPEIAELIAKSTKKTTGKLADSNVPTLLNAKEAAHMVGVARGTWYDLVNSGNAPLPVPLSGTLRRWRRDEVEDYIEKRSQARFAENTCKS